MLDGEKIKIGAEIAKRFQGMRLRNKQGKSEMKTGLGNKTQDFCNDFENRRKLKGKGINNSSETATKDLKWNGTVPLIWNSAAPRKGARNFSTNERR